MQSMLMNVPHRHVVFTLPHSLHQLILLNQKDLTNALLSISGNLMRDYLLKEHGVRAGVIAVLHTYGEKKNLHVHVHMIVSWGGERVSDGKLKVINNPYVKYEVLKERFKNQFIKTLTKLHKNTELVHRFATPKDFADFISKLDTHKWILHFEDPMKIPTQVITYIARYSKRACISEYKILDISDDHITFRYKDYKEKDENGKAVEKELHLHYQDFIPRLLQHVPLPYFRLVRYYGAYNPLSGVNKNHLFVNKDSQKAGVGPEPASQVQDQSDTIVCSFCLGTMIYIETQVSRQGANWHIYKKRELLKRQEMREKNVA
jgi:phage gp36-like protein